MTDSDRPIGVRLTTGEFITPERARAIGAARVRARYPRRLQRQDAAACVARGQTVATHAGMAAHDYTACGRPIGQPIVVASDVPVSCSSCRVYLKLGPLPEDWATE